MKSNVTCPHCEARLEVEYKPTEQSFLCATCRKEFKVRPSIPDAPAGYSPRWKAILQMVAIVAVQSAIAGIIVTVLVLQDDIETATKTVIGAIVMILTSCGVVYHYDVHAQAKQDFPEVYREEALPEPDDKSPEGFKFWSDRL